MLTLKNSTIFKFEKYNNHSCWNVAPFKIFTVWDLAIILVFSCSGNIKESPMFDFDRNFTLNSTLVSMLICPLNSTTPFFCPP